MAVNQVTSGKAKLENYIQMIKDECIMFEEKCKQAKRDDLAPIAKDLFNYLLDENMDICDWVENRIEGITPGEAEDDKCYQMWSIVLFEWHKSVEDIESNKKYYSIPRYQLSTKSYTDPELNTDYDEFTMEVFKKCREFENKSVLMYNQPEIYELSKELYSYLYASGIEIFELIVNYRQLRFLNTKIFWRYMMEFCVILEEDKELVKLYCSRPRYSISKQSFV